MGRISLVDSKNPVIINPIRAIAQKLKCWFTIRQEPSCANCAHIVTWSDPGSYWEPPDSGWDCGIQTWPWWVTDLRPVNVFENAVTEEEVQRLGCWGCPAYQFKDWQQVYQWEAEADKQYWEQLKSEEEHAEKMV